ncbi:MFS transporter [Saccharopolyspora sp. WRP15-2]|uniref:MFS transporter n=1 Tax=Saccharopolyspora oryzae TaxID=2997343 RepID=A0ABT4URV0_9PSEU|nr:MFS transporter [Saccharopolyspora oryzae]MDA3624434.1 MFS transporter [Saccharopolyspora oryzae]
MTTTTATPVAVRTRRWQLRIFAITWIAYAAFYFTRQAFSAAKVGILDDPSVNTVLTKQVLGDLDAAYLAAYAVGQFVWGSLADRWGPRVVVLGGMAMSAVAAMFMGLVPAVALFLPLMIVQGLAQSTGWASLCKNVSSFFPSHQRGRVLGLWSTNYAFGGLVASPFVGWVAYTLWSDWRVAFLAGAGVLVIVLIAFAVFQRNHPAQVGLDSHDEAAVPAEERPSLREALLTGVRDRNVRTLGLAYFLLKPARYAILLWGPVIVTERIPDVGKFEAVVIPVAFGVAGLLAPIAIGFISDKLFAARRMPPCVLSLAALVVALALFIPLTASGSVGLMVTVLAVIGFTAYAADAMISCVAAVDFGTSARAGAAAGFVNGCGSVGAILGGLLPGYLGGTSLFLGFAGAALLAGLVLVPRWNQRPAE